MDAGKDGSRPQWSPVNNATGNGDRLLIVYRKMTVLLWK